MCEGVRMGVHGGGTVHWRCILGPGGLGPGSWGCVQGGVCGSLGGLGVPWGMELFAVGVCWLPGVGGGEACSAGGSVAGVCG